ncbi:transcriptional repressor [Aureimonas endophytica]|uniref:Ferric uptake regulation protein n=2 Tax=Aureimonas endophytica TaxID=2027858 RepID=A0A917A182_9HYPH|nr:transcriptional repressor [Aureimonas endophytica]
MAVAMDGRGRKQGFCVFERLRAAGLRPTRQRVALCNLIFSKGDRHLSAEELYEEAHRAGESVSLATVYNTLHQFTDSGIIRPLTGEGQRTYFDTNTSDHHHFFLEEENRMIDIPNGGLRLDQLPDVPEGMEIVNVDIVVRLRRKAGAGKAAN